MTMFTTASSATVGKNAPTQGSYDSLTITPSDSVDLLPNSTGHMVRRLKVTGAGNVSVNLVGGGTAVYTGIAAGQVFFANVSRVLATGTTATGIWGLF